MVRKFVAELRDYDNIFYEIMNEPYARKISLEGNTTLRVLSPTPRRTTPTRSSSPETWRTTQQKSRKHTPPSQSSTSTTQLPP